MRLSCTWILALMLMAGSAGAAPSNEEVQARKTALDLAGAFTNDGFKLRDGYWTGRLSPQKARVVQVNLYAGNEYWFSVGATEKAGKLSITVYDETGKKVDFDPFGEGHTAAAGFSPEVSGPYFLKIEELEGDTATFCLLYSYK